MRYNVEEYIGKIYGGWEIIKDHGMKNNGNRVILCRCKKCGNEIEILLYRLLHNKARQCNKCGCYGRDVKKYIGKKFGKWTVVGDNGIRSSNGAKCVRCRCECGVEREIRLDRLINGEATKCQRCANTKHGGKHNRLYTIWINMKSRCYNKKNNRYKRYGGRGIKVCKEWKNNFVAFREWAMGNGYGDKLTIDRININGDYEPSNCRWVTLTEQSQNKEGLRDHKGGYIGIFSYTKVNNKKTWGFQIHVNGKKIQKSIYTTEKEALEARNQYIKNNGLDKIGYKIQEYKGE